MARIQYESYRPSAQSKILLETIIEIVEDYSQQNLKLTLRQLYYQLVSRDLIPNEEKSYKNIGTIVSRARRGGLLDWDAIEDRVRRPQKPSEFESLKDLVDAALYSYRLPRQQGQDRYVELWVEKDALAGVLWPIANKYHITLMVNRGYSSTSAMKDAGDRIRRQCEMMNTGAANILYLGDLDPSGEDMVRDIDERLDEYINRGDMVDDLSVEFGNDDEIERMNNRREIDLTVEKLALTMPQVKKYDPPPNPAKLSDSRAAKFVKKHGYSSWEVDALPPNVLRMVIEGRLNQLIDRDTMQVVLDREEQDKNKLRAALQNLTRS
jgi:hypothetical protein